MENRETKVVIQSGLRLKLAFEVFWKFSCLFWHPLLTSSITLQCGRKRKSFVTHRWFKISLIELLDPEEGTTWCTQWSAETFAQKMLSVSPPNVPVKVLLFFNERKTPSLVLNVTKVYFLQSQLQFPWNKSRNYQGSARASFYQNPTGEDKTFWLLCLLLLLVSISFCYLGSFGPRKNSLESIDNLFGR